MIEEPNSPVPVLLVEDNEIDVEIARRTLARTGSSVQLNVARDGQEALDVLLQGQRDGQAALPRVILLDLRLPVMDGREVLRRIKRDPQLCAIPVVIVTGAKSQRQMLECLELGTNMYFVKPMTTSDFVNVITLVQKYWTLLDGVMRRTSSP